MSRTSVHDSTTCYLRSAWARLPDEFEAPRTLISPLQTRRPSRRMSCAYPADPMFVSPRRVLVGQFGLAAAPAAFARRRLARGATQGTDSYPAPRRTSASCAGPWVTCRLVACVPFVPFRRNGCANVGGKKLDSSLGGCKSRRMVQREAVPMTS